VREALLDWRDVTDSLAWPTLLRVPALALRPERVVLGVVGVVAMALVSRLGTLWAPDQTDLATAVGARLAAGARGVLAGTLAFDAGLLAGGARSVVSIATDVLGARPWTALALGPLLLLVFAVLSGAIARSAASEIGLARVPRAAACLGWAVSRWFSLWISWFGPLVLAGVFLGVIALGGVLFRVPGLDVLGSVLVALGFVLAAIAVIILIAVGVGGWMLAPAVACEGTDAMDAIQRALAYTLGRPVRLAAYLVLLIALGGAALGIAAALLGAIDTALVRSIGLFLPEGTWPIPADARGTSGVARSIVSFWRLVPEVLLAGYAFSLVATGGAALYLVCRRVNDGQEMSELWEPSAFTPR
jgi:hypothetical protein